MSEINRINCLDKGYVRFVDKMGDDLSAVNAARVSYDKEVAELTARDEKLLSFLIQEGHTSPFRHASICFELYAPLLVARQHWKYAVASTFVDDQNGWNESSRRYVTEEPEFYVPNISEWRKAPENSKQGSGDNFSDGVGIFWTKKLEEYLQVGERLYHEALEAGIAPEQARLFLPAYGMYVRYRWTTSLQGVMHFLEQRLAHEAQKEITEYAKAIRVLAHKHFPVSLSMFGA
jgi:thymidylate synthase (FAD)